MLFPKQRQRRVILKVNVDISSSSSAALLISEGDVPEDVVHHFAAANKLDSSAERALLDHVKSTVKQVHREQSTEVSRTPKMLPEATSTAQLQRPPEIQVSEPSSSPALLRGTPSMRSSRGRGGRLWSGGRNFQMQSNEPVKNPNLKIPLNSRHLQLYEDARWKEKKRLAAQKEAALQREKDEMEGATFHPKLNSNRSHGIFIRSLSFEEQRDRFLLTTGRKRIDRETQELASCTFKPTVNARSVSIVGERGTKNLFETLYQDGWLKQRARVAGFKGPTAIASSPPSLERKLFNHGSHRRSRSASNLRYDDDFRPNPPKPTPPPSEHSVNLFLKKSPPIIADILPRREPPTREGRPLCEYLYHQAEEIRKRKEFKEKEFLGKFGRGVSTTIQSRQIIQIRKKEKFRELFSSLTGEGEILRAGRYSTENVPSSFLPLLAPILNFVDNSDIGINFTKFCDAIELRLSQAKGPTCHLFLDRDNPEPSFEPSFMPNEGRRHHRSRSADALYSELVGKDKAKLERLENLRKEINTRELSECSFQPFVRKNKVYSGDRYPSRRTGRGSEEPSWGEEALSPRFAEYADRCKGMTFFNCPETIDFHE